MGDADPAALAYLLRFDTILGRFPDELTNPRRTTWPLIPVLCTASPPRSKPVPLLRRPPSTRQSGVPGLRLADLVRDADILEQARAEAETFLAQEKGTAAVQQANRYIQENWQRMYGLSQVG